MADILGFGRIIERGELDEGDEAPGIVLNKLDSPTAHSALSTGRDLTRCLSDETHVSPEKVSASEAQLICKSVLSELLNPKASSSSRPAGPVIQAIVETPREEVETPRDPTTGIDYARVEVTASDRGCIRGMLQWIGLGAAVANNGKEKVAFTLLEIRQGYTVVGETVEGPKLLSSLCWKLQSINGSSESRPAWIRRGDVLMLQGPKWATKRLHQPLPTAALQKSHAESPGRPSAEVASLAATSSRSVSAAPLPPEPPALVELSTSTRPQIAKPSLTNRAPPPAVEAPEKGSSLAKSINFEVVQASLMGAPRVQDSGGYSKPMPLTTPATKEDYDTTKDYDTTMSEATNASGSQQDKPIIPILDLNAVGKRRDQKMQKDAAAQLPCDPTSGCDFGWFECNMLQPPKPIDGDPGEGAETRGRCV